ncbi:MAG: helix-turn-helix domain-containing protein [Mycobacteriales bacterium]
MTHPDCDPAPMGRAYLACWPVAPEAQLAEVTAAARADLARQAQLAGARLVASPTFLVVDAAGWHAPFGEPGDLLLLALTPARRRCAHCADAAPGPVEPIAADVALPADVVAREQGRADVAARQRAVAELRRLGWSARQIAERTGCSRRTVERLLAPPRAAKASPEAVTPAPAPGRLAP